MASNEQLDAIIDNFTIRVLLVDDQAIIGAQVKKMLEDQSDIEFHFCKEPLEAVKKAIEIKPTVILQDLVMPDVEGLQLVKFYRNSEQLRDVPVIVLSSKEDAETKRDSFETGANDYYVKSFDESDKIELIARIRYHSQGYINLLKLKKTNEELKDNLQKAKEFVFSTLPKKLSLDKPLIANDIKLSTEYIFAPTDALGGDIFGYFKIDEDNWVIYLLDVSGHGVGSALLSVSAHNALRSRQLPGVDFRVPAEVLSALNNSFQMEDNNLLYFTLWYGVYNFKTKTLRYASAGHPPALAIDKNGERLELSTENFIIGGMPDFNFTDAQKFIEPPFSLYVYSDGCYEITLVKEEKQSENEPMMWTFGEMFDFLQSRRDEAGGELAELEKEVIRLNGSEILDDDFSIVKAAFNAQ